MRGEYKVPGGKLAAIDVESDGETITRAALSGDFFLDPDEALDDINRALTGQSATASADQLAGAIEASLASDVTMIGFTLIYGGLGVVWFMLQRRYAIEGPGAHDNVAPEVETDDSDSDEPKQLSFAY